MPIYFKRRDYVLIIFTSMKPVPQNSAAITIDSGGRVQQIVHERSISEITLSVQLKIYIWYGNYTQYIYTVGTIQHSAVCVRNSPSRTKKGNRLLPRRHFGRCITLNIVNFTRFYFKIFMNMWIRFQMFFIRCF